MSTGDVVGACFFSVIAFCFFAGGVFALTLLNPGEEELDRPGAFWAIVAIIVGTVCFCFVVGYISYWSGVNH